MKAQKFGFNKIRIKKIFSVAALLYGAATLFYACENNIEEIKAFSSPEALPIIEATNFETLFTDSGQVRFSLKTTKLLRYENEGKEFVEFPEGMEIVKYDANRNIISTLTADYAKQFLVDDTWEAKNNVVATNEQGDTLKTEHLFWEQKSEKIYTEEFVKIIRPDQVITGIGFTSDQAMQNWKIKNPKGTIFLNVENKKSQESTPEIESDVKIDETKTSKGQLQFEN